jgi:magnesium transporter
MRARRLETLGVPAGTLKAPPGAYVPKTVRVFHYTAQAIEEVETASLDDVARIKGTEGVTWVNVDGLGNADLIGELGTLFGFHPLALEDALNTPQRAKMDDYGSHLFAVLRMLHFEEQVETEQVSIFLCPNVVVTIQERPGDCLEPVRQRLRKEASQVRRQGADYLMYAILDAIIDNYFPFLEQVGEVVEHLEDEVVQNPKRHTVARVHAIKRHLLDVRRSVWPLREALNTLLRDESPLVHKATRPYLRDCYDHAVQVLEIVETYRELTAGLMDVYLSSLSNKMNEVMKVLTVIATIFIPLTFLAGVYGMNFQYMPELHQRWAYPALWGLMVFLAVGMLVIFRRKGWLGGRKEE